MPRLLQVAALQETLQGLGQSDGMLLQLTEQKAALQLQLRDAQVGREGHRGRKLVVRGLARAFVVAPQAWAAGPVEGAG